jgi:hypothetical protein
MEVLEGMERDEGELAERQGKKEKTVKFRQEVPPYLRKE